jgi:RNA polymerase sigma factor (sigma-70 family)
MAASQLTDVVQHLRRYALLRDGGGLSDGQLLECYLQGHEDAAFAALVRRHGPMVWGVCRRIIGSHHDAEDAFQATFLVLVRKAAAVQPRQMVGNWLYGVAYQTALKAKASASKRRTRERQVADMPEPEVAEDLLADLLPVLDRELSRLPDKYRVPVVLCDLEGKSYKEAARQLGCPEGTISARLSRARSMLARRLARHGLALSAGSLATLIAQNAASACVPPALISSTIKTVTLVAAGKVAAAVSANAAALVEGVVRTMLLSKLKCIPVLLLAISGLAFGVGVLRQAVATEQEEGAVPVKSAAFQLKPRFEAFSVTQSRKTDPERILGSWRIAKARVHGREEPNETLALARMTFSKDGKLAMTMATELAKEGTYKIVGPGQIDLQLDTDMRAGLGIYKFEGDDRLYCCFNNDIDAKNAKRPTEFSAEKDTHLVLFILHRTKPGEEKPTADELAKNQKAVDKVRQATARTLTATNLRHIGIGMHQYNDQHKSLPAHAIYSKDGKKALLSWRVAILPFIEQDALYREFKLDEPWDSEHNKKLISKMPPIFHSTAGAKREDGLTHYQVVTGPDAVFDGPTKLALSAITDGTSSTIMAIETKEPVIWTKPADLILPRLKEKMPKVDGLYKDQLIVVFCDGSVRYLPSNIDPVLLRALITPNGGEVVDLDKGKK